MLPRYKTTAFLHFSDKKREDTSQAIKILSLGRKTSTDEQMIIIGLPIEVIKRIQVKDNLKLLTRPIHAKMGKPWDAYFTAVEHDNVDRVSINVFNKPTSELFNIIINFDPTLYIYFHLITQQSVFTIANLCKEWNHTINHIKSIPENCISITL